MKKFILLLMALVTLSVSAQTTTKLTAPQYFYKYTGLATDTVGAVGTTWSKAILLNKSTALYYTVSVKVADQTAGAKCSVKLQGKIFDADNYSDITTITWYGGGTDSTLVFQNISTRVYYRYFRVYVTQIANKAKVSAINVSLRK